MKIKSTLNSFEKSTQIKTLNLKQKQNTLGGTSEVSFVKSARFCIFEELSFVDPEQHIKNDNCITNSAAVDGLAVIGF